MRRSGQSKISHQVPFKSELRRNSGDSVSVSFWGFHVTSHLLHCSLTSIAQNLIFSFRFREFRPPTVAIGVGGGYRRHWRWLLAADSRCRRVFRRPKAMPAMSVGLGMTVGGNGASVENYLMFLGVVAVGSRPVKVAVNGSETRWPKLKTDITKAFVMKNQEK
jgi:hypothetical protein